MSPFYLTYFNKIKMAQFNEKKQPEKNLAGGRAYRESENMQLAAVLLTSFGDDKYYASNLVFKAQLYRLIEACDKEFAAKAIVYARREFGMRTITHYAASILAKYIGSEPWAKDFFNSVIVRPDDMTEIVACTLSRKEKISNAMIKVLYPLLSIGRDESWMSMTISTQRLKRKSCGSIGRYLCETSRCLTI